MSSTFSKEFGHKNPTKNTIISLMKGTNINARTKNDLLKCLNKGKTFAYAPEKLKQDTVESCPVKKQVSLPNRPIQRLKNTIVEAGSYQVEPYRPDPSKTRPSMETERLQNIMAYGKEYYKKSKPQSNKIKNAQICDSLDLFDEILKEISEREEFLHQMNQLGLRNKYLPEIQCQISLRLKELEKLDKERAQEISKKYS